MAPLVRAISVYISNEAPFSSNTTVSWVWLGSDPRVELLLTAAGYVVKRVLGRKDAVAG
jgi:hypothetical protein